jgi:acyl-CoA thioester hydrolase
MKIRVYYEDTDTGGVVYHSKYLNFCERARSELFFKEDLLPFEAQNEGFVVKSLSANFILPAKLGDILEVKSFILEQKRASLKLKQEIFLKDKKIFEAKITLVYLKNQKIAKIPRKFLEILGKVEKI